MIVDFIHSIFENNAALATIFMALIPLIELKGAIPFGVSISIWGDNALTLWQAFVCSIGGGIFITIILALIFKPIFNLLKEKKFFKSIISFFTSLARQKAQTINSLNDNLNSNTSTTQTLQTKTKTIKSLIKILTVLGFVALPIPGTGVYTGTALAIMLGLNFKTTFIFVTLGNIIAGIIILTICAIFPAFTDVLLVIFLVLIAIFIIYRLIIFCKKKKISKIKP